MTATDGDEPPVQIWYDLEEPLMIQSGQLAVVVGLERQIRDLSRKLHFDVEGDSDD